MHRTSCLSALGSILLAASLPACKKQEITVSDVPASPAPSASQSPPPPNHPPIHETAKTAPQQECSWTAPEGWEDAGATAMRAGNWIVRDASGNSAEITAMAFAGDVGGDFANVNRWLSQIGAAPMTQEDFASRRNGWLFSVGNRPALLVPLQGKSEAILAAIVPLPDKTWFFKMKGEKSLVEKQRPSFEDFLQTISWNLPKTP